MKQVKTSALHFKQNGTTMTITKMTGNQLLNYTTVEPFNSDLEYTDENQGYQRPLGVARAKKLGNFLHKKITEHKENPKNKVFPMPTAILLSDRGVNVSYGENSMEFDTNAQFKIADGQTRIAGIRHAIEEKGNEDLGNFEFSVIILRNLEKEEEMEQFRVVNGEAKSVNTALVNTMLVRIQMMKGIEHIDEKIRWKVIAQKTLENLNNTENGVWFDKIIMPDKSKYSRQEVNENPEKAHKRITFSTSFITSLKPIITRLQESGYWGDNWSTDARVESLTNILVAFWSSLSVNMKKAFENSNDYVIQKTPGVFAMHYLLRELIRRNYQARMDLESPDSYERYIGGGKLTSIDSSYWQIGKDNVPPGYATAYGSMKGFRELYESILDEIDNA